MQILNQDIRDRTFKPVYLLYGEEGFLKNSYKNKLKEAVTGGDTMNFNYFEGKSLDVDEIISLADTMPFFAERRLILIEDSGFFKSASEKMAEYVGRIPGTACIVFVESEVDKRSRMFKKVKETGHAAELKRQDAAQLSRWAAGILSKSGKKITSSTMDLFLSRAGDDMENIRMELEKLICYTMGREVVTDQDVEDICTVRLTNKIFDMVAAIVARKPGKAMGLYEDLLALKEPPMRILYLIARQFNQLLAVKELTGKGLDKSAVASRLKIPPFAAGRMIPQAKAFSDQQILSYVTQCVEIEEAVKSGRLGDRVAVELLITKKY